MFMPTFINCIHTPIITIQNASDRRTDKRTAANFFLYGRARYEVVLFTEAIEEIPGVNIVYAMENCEDALKILNCFVQWMVRKDACFDTYYRNSTTVIFEVQMQCSDL